MSGLAWDNENQLQEAHRVPRCLGPRCTMPVCQLESPTMTPHRVLDRISWRMTLLTQPIGCTL